MPVWLGLLILVAIVALTIAVVWSGWKWGQFTEENARTNRKLIAEFLERTENAASEINASTALLHASMNDALGAFARIRKDGGNLPPKEPKPAPFTSEENVG